MSEDSLATIAADSCSNDSGYSLWLLLENLKTLDKIRQIES